MKLRLNAVFDVFVLYAVVLLNTIASAANPAAAPASELTNPAILKSEFIFEKAPFEECHAATVVETKSGLLAAWFGGTEEGARDVCIWLATEQKDGWTPPVRVADGVQANGEQWPCWNPVLFQPQGGPLMLFYKVGPSPGTWWGVLKTSKDAGRTWSDARRLPEGILGPIKNKPVQLARGEILCPSSTEDHGWRVHFERTRDLGFTWEKTPPVNDGREFGAIQPSILIHGRRDLQAVGRTRQKKVFDIRSKDGGKTWGRMSTTSLPNPNSGIDAVTLRDGRHLIVYNHCTTGRTPLNVADSKNGSDWTPLLVLEDAPGEYSYPAVIQAKNKLVHIVYTWKRLRIKHAVVDPRKLQQPK